MHLSSPIYVSVYGKEFLASLVWNGLSHSISHGLSQRFNHSVNGWVKSLEYQPPIAGQIWY